jgi:Lrp/AsnC family transcriptional regulator for asnA, asnC and gidA
MPPGLDPVDRLLLRELQTDARQSNVSLAAKVGLTEGAVRRRIDNLLASAFRIVAVGDPELLGLTTHAVIGIRAQVGEIERLASDLAEMRELSYVYETTGQFDIIVVGFFGSNGQLREFLIKKLAKVSGVIDSDTFLVMRTVKRSFRWGEGADDGTTEEEPPPKVARRASRRRSSD